MIKPGQLLIPTRFSVPCTIFLTTFPGCAESIIGSSVLQLLFSGAPASNNFLDCLAEIPTNASWLDTGGLATKPGSPFHSSSPANAAKRSPAVDLQILPIADDYPLLALLGMVTEVDAQYNFDKTGKPLAQGAPVVRRYGVDSYGLISRMFGKVKPNFTLTLGLRYSLFSPPWETNGLEVVPNLNLSQWFNTRAAKIS